MVKNLFFNVPARRRFLKANATELRHIVNEFQRIALANPDVSFSLTHNEQLLFHLPKGKLLQRINDVIGKQSSAQMVPVETETSLVNIHGFVGKPQIARKTMGDQFFFVNNRFMKSPYLHKAVTVAYENLVAAEHNHWPGDEPETMILPSRGNDEEENEQQTFASGTSSEKTETGTLYFQIKNKFIITSVKSGIMIIDQRRAHERILFEDFLKNIQAGASVSQQSLFPEEITFNEEDAMLLRDIHTDLRIFGFELQEKDNRTFAITGQPSFLKNINAPKLIDAILDAFKSGEVDPEREIREQMAIIMAQNACMRPGEFLTQAEMAELINKLFLCSAPNFTPGGKTVFSILDNEELEKRFL
jgi:DNA mismatch repair ATPase MutL